MTSLLEKVLAAYGGRDRWQRASRVRLVLSAGGWAFRLKWQRALARVSVELSVREPWARITPIDRAGNAGVLDGGEVRLESPAGETLESRPEARRCFPGGRRLIWWDALDQAYFAGYAAWNYFCFPALLLRADIRWSQVGDITLLAEFPPTIPTHSPVQAFHVDPASGLLRQHDYTAEVFGSWARAANVIRAHDISGGVLYTSHRRVTPRRKDGTPVPFPLLVDIHVHEYHLH